MNLQIRLGHTDSVNSTDRQNFLDVELKNTSKLSHFTDIKATIDQYEQFNTERENCNKYRLILTINPYCTNVLFNPFTEIVYAEGASEYRNQENVILFNGCEAIVNGDTSDDSKAPAQDHAGQLNKAKVYGNTQPNRVQMVMNTEYSKPGCANDSKDKNGRTITDENYVYHPGYDIFNNHILRNKSFKIVNKPENENDHESFFNTIADKMRYADGKQVEYRRRESLQDDTMPERDKHLYDYADILQFSNGDAINANLTEENGWYGFINTSTIQSRDSNFDELNIGRVLNDRKSCEFIDMYPDRTLYSFNPKYNKYQHREEYNWEVILTYPYKNVVTDKKNNDYKVVKDGECNGLLILSAVKTMSPSNETIILFRCMTKHGLKRGDTVRFYYIEKEGESKKWQQYEKNFIVRNVGNLENEQKEYYFYINDMDFIRLLPGDGPLDDTSDNELSVNDNYEYRFARIVGNVPSRYYIRVFKKLPNFKYAEQKFPTDGSMTIDDYINNNAKYPKNFPNQEKKEKMVLYDKEQYKLAFESTIYNDDSTQIVFTDTIDIDNLVDSRGCPLTEIYTTIVKTNYGHDMWYETPDNPKPIRNHKSIEFSHCFGPVSEGLQFSQIETESKYAETNRRNCGDVCMLCVEKDKNTNKYFVSTPYNENVTIGSNDEFLGDIVEFNPNECIEKSLQFFMHRFNTAQRELNDGRLFRWNEIWSDDWDAKPSNEDHVITDKTDKGDFPFSVTEETLDDDTVTQRHEGYFYQPHYRIPLREFGAIIQDQHYDVNINKIEPVQADAIYLKIVTKTRSGVNKGDIIYLFDDKNNKVYDFIVTYVENKVSFYVMPYVKEGNPWQIFNSKSQLNWLDICNLAVPDDNGEIKLYFRIKNEEIPPYAEKVGKNKYLWREVLKPGNMDIQNLPEYAYSNNAFYISNEINFFLKRQDPQGWNNLYYENGFPNDIRGNIKKESNYIYKEEKEIIC